MTEEKATIRLDAKGNAKEEVKKTSKEVDELGESTEKAGKKAEKSAKGFQVSKAAIAGIGLAAVEAGRQAVKAFADIQAAQGRLDRAVRKAGGSQGDYNKLIASARDSLNRYGTGLNESIAAYDVLIRQTGDVAEAQRAANLAIDIAAAENIDLSQAVEALRKAYNGEVEELKNLNGINKDRAHDLNRIEDATQRTREAVNLLSKEYSGAAEETKGLSNQIDTATGNLDSMAQSIGQVIAKVGELATANGSGDTSVLGGFAADLQQIADAFSLIREDSLDFKRWGPLALVKALGDAQTAEAVRAAQGPTVDPFERRDPNLTSIGSTDSNRPGVPDIEDAFGTPEERFGGPGGGGKRGGGRQAPEGLDPEIAALVGSMSNTSGGGTLDVAEAEDERRQNVIDKIDEGMEKQREKLALMEKERDALRQQKEALEAVAKAEDEELERKEKKAEAQQFNNELVQQGGQLALDAAKMAGAGEAEVAIMRAVMETAMGISEAVGVTSLGIAPNPVSAVAHFTSAARYAAVAAMSGGGGKGGGASSKSASGGAGVDTLAQGRNQQEREAREPRETKITLDFSRSNVVGPEGERFVAEAAQRGMRQVLGNPDIF